MTIRVNTEKYGSLTLEPLIVEQVVVPAKPILPPAPFPRKYVHSVFVNLQDAKLAAQKLRSVGYSERDVYVLQGHDFVEILSRNQTPFGFLTAMDYEVYLYEASQGRSFLAIRPANYTQLKQIRDLLVPYHAYHASYIDTWTVADLLP